MRGTVRPSDSRRMRRQGPMTLNEGVCHHPPLWWFTEDDDVDDMSVAVLVDSSSEVREALLTVLPPFLLIWAFFMKKSSMVWLAAGTKAAGRGSWPGMLNDRARWRLGTSPASPPSSDGLTLRGHPL